MRPILAALRRAFPLIAALSLSLMAWPAGLANAGRASTARPLAGGGLPVMVLAGQSNMVGWLTNVNDLPTQKQATQTSVLFYGPNENGSTWGPLTPPTVTGNRFGPEVSLGQYLVTSGAFGRVAQVKYAVGGTNLASDWDPDRAHPFLYAQMLARVRQSVSALQAAYPDQYVYVAGFFWMQGESDGMNNNLAAAYDANLTHFIARLRADLHAPGLPVIVGRVRWSTAYAGTVRQAEEDVAANVANVRLVDTDGLPLEQVDQLHYTSAGIVTLGNDFAASFLEWQGSLNHIFLPTIAADPVAGAQRR